MTDLALVESVPLGVPDIHVGVWRQAPDHLEPAWRLEPNHEQLVFVLALDPREAGFVFGRGWATLNGHRYLPTLEGWDGRLEKDGRVCVRFELAELDAEPEPYRDVSQDLSEDATAELERLRDGLRVALEQMQEGRRTVAISTLKAVLSGETW